MSDKEVEEKLTRQQHVQRFWGVWPVPCYRFQLFSIRVKYKFDKPGKLYGYVEMDGSGTGVVSLFDCAPESSVPIENNGVVPLTDPTAVPSAKDVTLTSQLFVIIDGEVKDSDEDEEEGFDVSCRELHWDMSRQTLRTFDCCSSALSKGKYGDALIYYVPIEVAVKATMEISFKAPDDDVNGNGRKYNGKIMAYYSDFHFDCTPAVRENYFKLTLFEADPNVCLKTGKIPLLRSMLAVPHDCSLKIEAGLWDDDDDSGEAYLHDFHCFFTLPKDSSSYRIKGKNGCHLDLKVFWKYEPSPDDHVL